jgi:hypothetical protein
LIAKNNKSVSTISSPPSLITPKNVVKKELEIVVPAGKSLDDPYKTDSESLKILWKCLGCTPEILYTVRITELDGKGKPIISKTQGKEHTIRLEPGKYKVVVSGDGLTSKPKFFTINKGGNSNIFFLMLLLAALAVLGYFIWKNFDRSKKSNLYIEKPFKEDGLFDGAKRDTGKPAGSSSGGLKKDDNIIDDF